MKRVLIYIHVLSFHKLDINQLFWNLNDDNSRLLFLSERSANDIDENYMQIKPPLLYANGKK